MPDGANKNGQKLQTLWRWLNKPLWRGGEASLPVSPEDMLRQEYAHVLGKPDWISSSSPLPALIRSLQGDPALPDGDGRPQALCLSGGGIRSATFSLGVLQWLAGHDRLKDFHYLSTVSGGGYIGSFLVNGLRQSFAAEFLSAAEPPARLPTPRPPAQRLQRILQLQAIRPEKTSAANRALRDELAALLREQKGVERAEIWVKRLGSSAGTEHAAEAAGANRISGGVQDPIAPLRAYSNYLSPTGGLSTDAFALAAIFLRNLLLNLLVWLPLLAAAVALPRLYIALLAGGPSLHPSSLQEWWPTWLALLAIILGVAYIVADLPPPKWRQPALPQKAPSNRFSPLCFLPITGAAFLLSLLGAWTEPLHKLDWWLFAASGALAHGLGIFVGLPLRKWRKIGLRSPSYVGALAVLVVGGVGGFLTSLVLSQLGQGAIALQLSPLQQLLYASLAVPALTSAFWLAMALHAGLTGRVSSEEDREWWARATAAWLKLTLVWMAAFAVTVWAPLLILEHAAEAGLTAVKFGVGGSALGVVTALIGFWSKRGDQVKSKARGLMSATGVKLLDVMASAVLLAVLLSLSLTWNVVLDRCHDWGGAAALCSTDVHAQTELLREQVQLSAAAAGLPDSDAVRVLEPQPDPLSAQTASLGASAGTQVYAHVLLNGSGWLLSAASLLLLALAAFMAFCIGANQFSLHGMYGNRLVRAYLGSGRPVRHPHWFTSFDPDDNPKLADLGAPLRGDDGNPRLFPLLNLALNLVKPSERRLDWQQRKAASFFATPLHCGAYHLGFRATEAYAGGMSLGRAMTISGAAASPNMGYHSSPPVTAVMTLFNVRLGWWLPNTRRNPDWRKEQPALGLDIMLAEAGGATGDEDDFVYLSDGGHFDNTGLYEMVRRRCRRIVIVDGTCDGEFKWGDLLDIVRKIRVDFGVPITFKGELPGAGRASEHPRWLTGTIRYSARDPGIHDGELIVLKPMLLPGDPPELVAYARDSAKEGAPAKDTNRFPHQSTADQFYDEQQFESYRLLGWLTADAALRPPKEPTPGQGSPAENSKLAAALTGAIADGVKQGIDGEGEARGGIGQLVQQMGSGIFLASALTVGGTLGVAGSVALQPSQISLSAADRELLKGAIKSPADGARLKLDDEDRRVLKEGLHIRLDKEAEQTLLTAAATFEAALKGLAAWSPPVASAPAGTLRVALDPASLDALNQLKIAINLAVTSSTPGSFQALRDALLKLESKLDALPSKGELAQALKAPLDQLTRAVNAVAPRQNIRGQEGAPR